MIIKMNVDDEYDDKLFHASYVYYHQVVQRTHLLDNNTLAGICQRLFQG
jgi:hypothetical protein